jgi:L-glyceraldehyde 3-phosphate reductase
MNLAYVELFYIHRYDPLTPLEETLQALVDIVKMGKALYVGISRWPLEATLFGLRYLQEHNVRCLCYQGRLNMLDQEVVTSGVLKAVHDAGVGFVSFSPLAQGLLTNRYLNGIPQDSRMRKEASLQPSVLTPELQQHLTALNEEAEAQGKTLAQMALRWVLDHEGVTSVIVGASSVEQLADSLGAIHD